MRLLICYQVVADDPLAGVEDVVRENPSLRESEFLDDLLGVPPRVRPPGSVLARSVR